MNFSKTQFFSLGLLLIGLLATMTAFGANFTSVQNGSWDDPATWDLNAVPTVNDNVTITSAHAVTTTAITISFNDLTLEGTLELGTFTQTNVQKTIVNSSGTITATNRIFIAEDVDMGSNIVLNAGGQLDYRDYDFTGINGTPTITVNSGASFFLTSFANVPHTMSNIDVVNFGFFGKTGGSVGPNAGDHIIDGTVTNESGGVIEVKDLLREIQFTGTVINKAGATIEATLTGGPPTNRGIITFTGNLTNDGSILYPAPVSAAVDGDGTFNDLRIEGTGSIGPDACLGIGTLSLFNKLAVDVNGLVACTDYDQQSTTTSAFLGNASVLELNFGSFTPTVNDLFTIIQGNGTTGVNGTFATVTGLPAGFEVKYDFPNTGDVSVGDINYTPAPGIFISVQNGSWDDPATWDVNAVPTANDNVTVTSAHAVTATATTISFNDLTLEGTLTLGTFTQTNVQKTIVNSSGTITATNRIFIAEDVDMGSNIVLNAGGLLDYRDYDFTGINGTPTITVNSGASFFVTSFANVPHTMSNIDVVNFGFFGKTGGSVGPNAGDHIIDGTVTNESGGVIEVKDLLREIQFTGTVINKAGATIEATLTGGPPTNRGIITFTGNLTNDGSILYPAPVSAAVDGDGTFNDLRIEGTGSIGPDACLSIGTLALFNKLAVEVNGLVACTDYDQQSTTTSAFLGNASVLELNFGSFTPTVNDLFTIIQGNGTTGVNGTFATVTGLPAGFEVKYDFPNTGDVSVGDINYVGVSPLEFVVGNPTAGPNNTVTVPITVNHFDDIATFQGTFTFDPAVLTFSSASGPTGSTDFVAPYMNFGTPGTGNVPNNVVTFSWFEKNGGRLSQVDGTTVMELTFTVNGSATTGSTAIGIDGSSTALGYSNDVAATVLETPDVTAGGVTIDADPPTVLTASIQSNNANDISLATVGDVITLSFTSSEALPANPVVTIDRGGAGSITITDQGGATTWTAEKTVAAGDDGVVTFSISIQDQYGNTSVQTVTTDASSVTVDTEAPVLVNCPANIAQNNDLGICGAAITWTAPTATDNLPGVSVAQTAGDPSGSTFPVGNSQITYTATDAAGNTSSCSFDIDITDNEDPVVLTQNFSVTLDMTGAATITVNDIDAGSTDNCAIDTRVLSRTSFDCDDVPNSPITVTLTVTDIYGNSASADADVTVNLVPNISIAGDAKSELGTLIPSVDFDLDGDNGPQTANGSSYSFLVDPCDPVNTIGAERTGDASVNGIDINDALDVVRHTLLISQLNSPYKLIAADVNNSQTINVLDAFQILRRLLLITNSFTDPVSGNPGGVWTMIPSDYVFPNPQSPWGWDTRRSHTSVTAPLTGQDFTGVKLGDVNNSWDASPNRLAAPSDSIHFVIEAVQAQQGDLVRVPVKVANFDVISGYQFTMNWDESVLELKTVNHKALEALYNTEEAAKGHFTTAWIDMEGQAQSLADGTVAFELVFEVVGKRGSQTSFEINSALTESKALDMAKSRMGIGTIGGNVQVGAMTTSIDDDAFEGFALGQNSPNPFAEMTSLNFSLGQPQEVQISIFSMNGQLVRRFSGKFGTGQHEISWDGRNESGMKLGSGVYLVRMTADKFEASIKVRKTN